MCTQSISSPRTTMTESRTRPRSNTKQQYPRRPRSQQKNKKNIETILNVSDASISSSSSDDTHSTASCSTCATPPRTTTRKQTRNSRSARRNDERKSMRTSKNKGGKSPQGSTKQSKKNKQKTTKKNKQHNKKPIVVQVQEVSEEEKAKYVALDCEMVLVQEFISRVARVSIVNWYGETIYNKFIKVEEPVTDYLTFVSGITPQDIESDDAISFDECRTQVLDILDGKIVVGHALKNDFQVLDITHPWHMIRDTAKYEPFMVASKTNPNMLLPRKLKVLAKNKLGMIIQEDGKMHDSIEDATAAMELYIKARMKWEMAVEWKYQKTIMIMGH